MEKIKKLLTIYLTLFIALANFSVVFAEENEDIENNQEETQETEQEQEQQEIIVNYENQEQLDNIENNINEINNELNEIKPLILSLSRPRTLNKAYNFSFLYPVQLELLYENYNNYDFIYFDSDTINHYICLSNDYYKDSNITDENYLISIRYKTTISPTGVIDTNNVLYEMVSTGGQYNYLNIKNDTEFFDTYNLQPFKLNIINNGLGNISNSVNTEPYLSTNIYYNNQSITLTYDNENNDFNGWYINNELVSNNLSYSFNIITDTTINLNKINPIEDNTYTMILTCIFICLLFITFKSLIWGV